MALLFFLPKATMHPDVSDFLPGTLGLGNPSVAPIGPGPHMDVLPVRPSNMDYMMSNELRAPFVGRCREEYTIQDSIDPSKTTKIIHTMSLMDQARSSNTGSEWPLSTNLHCQWCTFTFQTRPCFIPISRSPSGVWTMNGHYCSFNCAWAELEQHITPTTRKYRELLELLYMELFDTPMTTSIHPAPSRNLLTEYGGKMDIHTFRNNFNTCHYNLIYPPMISAIPVLEEYQFAANTI